MKRKFFRWLPTTLAVSLLLATIPLQAQDPDGYEYWFDGGFDSRAAVDHNPGLSGIITQTLPVVGLSDGFHTLHLRSRRTGADGSPRWSGVSTYRFFKKTIDPANAWGYEYWFDGDRDNLASQNLTAPANNVLAIETPASISDLSDGFHTISLRVRGENGWSGVSTYGFFKNSSLPGGGITAWEYWWDDDIANKDSMLVQPPAQEVFFLNMPLDMSHLCKGRHTISLRFYGSGGWSSVLKYKFEKTLPRPGEEVANFEIVADGGLASFMNNSVNGTGYQWFFGDGSASTLVNPYHAYNTGVYEVILVNYGSCQNDTMRQTLVVPGVSGYTPKKGGKNAIVTLALTGTGFDDGMDVRLKRPGYADIEAETFVQNSGQMTAKFRFQDAPAGKWDVLVKFPNNQADTFPEGFTIEDSTYYQLSVKITSNWRMRSGVKNPMTVTVVNEGNGDATWVPLTISGLPQGTLISFLNARVGVEDLAQFDTIPFSIDSLPVFFYDSVVQSMFLPLLLPKLATGQNVAIQFEVIPPASANNEWITVAAEVGKPLWDELIDFPSDATLGGCLFALFERALLDELDDLQGIGGCVADIHTFAYGLFRGALEQSGADRGDKVEYFAGMAYGFVNLFVECAKAAGVNIPVAKPVKILIRLAEYYQNARDYYDLAEACAAPLARIGIAISNIQIGTSFDPNVKTGPGSGSAGHFYATDSDPLVYNIQCENDTSALFAAQTVTIIDTLDKTKLDIATFRFTHVHVAGHGITLNIAGTQFLRDIWLPVAGIIARVSGRLDTLTGVVTWVMRTIDPATGQETSNPEAGILQPNFAPPEGDASVGFAIRKLPGIPDDVLIENRATIIFDFNAPIVTNTWGVVSDNVPPLSQIGPLPAMQDSLKVHLEWQGSDNLSGVQFYRIYASDNGGPFYPWRAYETSTSAVFTAQAGHSYRFYSIAVDSAGNVEAPPAGFDAEIVIGGSVRTHSPTRQGYRLDQNIPNPFSGESRIDFVLPENCPHVLLRVIGVSGRTIREFAFQNQAAGAYSVCITSEELAPGVYFYQLLSQDVLLTRRMVVE